MLRAQLLKRVIAGQEGLILDQIGGAVEAWSLRYLTESYTGDVVAVSRGATLTIEGFTPSEITDGTMESFLSGTFGLVTEFISQVGGRNILPPSNTGFLVISQDGTPLLDVNGNPATRRNTINKTTDSPEITSSDSTMSAVFQTEGNSDAGAVFSEIGASDVNFNGHSFIPIADGASNDIINYRPQNTSNIINSVKQQSSLYQSISRRSGNLIEGYQNGVKQGDVTSSDNFGENTFFRIGSRGGNQNVFDGLFHEAIVWNRNLTDNELSTLTTDQKSHYGIL